MTGRPSKERRKTPRIRAEHRVQLQDSSEVEAVSFTAQSVDLSLGGIYCALDRCVPLFTKMSIVLSLPVQDQEGHVEHVSCDFQGVVVRMEPEEADPDVSTYQCALAFVNLDADVELTLARYLLQTMAGGGDEP